MRHAEQRPIVLGIDPGLDGAVAVLEADDTLGFYLTPTLSAGSGGMREYDLSEMRAMLTAHPVALAVIEAVGARPGQGRTSIFRFGCGYGLWLGLLAGLKIPFQQVRPQAWKQEILLGTAKDKAAAIALVQRRFPGVHLLATPRAAGSAQWYGRSHLLGLNGPAPSRSRAGRCRLSTAVSRRTRSFRATGV